MTTKTGKTDTRSDVLDQALYMAETAQAVDEADVLAAIDAADRAAGIVRVDTNDEALVERLAVVLWQDDYDREVIVSHTFTETFPAYQNDYRRRVRAVLAALREAAQ